MSLVEIKTQPTRRDLAVFGVLLFALAGLAGAALRFRWGHPRAAEVVWGAGAALGLAYGLVPGFRRPLYLAWTFLTWPIGATVSLVLLAAVYYLLLTPIGLGVRALGKDPMRRRFDRTAKTYWTPHPPERDVERYYRQS